MGQPKNKHSTKPTVKRGRLGGQEHDDHAQLEALLLKLLHHVLEGLVDAAGAGVRLLVVVDLVGVGDGHAELVARLQQLRDEGPGKSDKLLTSQYTWFDYTRSILCGGRRVRQRHHGQALHRGWQVEAHVVGAPDAVANLALKRRFSTGKFACGKTNRRVVGVAQRRLGQHPAVHLEHVGRDFDAELAEERVLVEPRQLHHVLNGALPIRGCHARLLQYILHMIRAKADKHIKYLGTYSYHLGRLVFRQLFRDPLIFCHITHLERKCEMKSTKKYYMERTSIGRWIGRAFEPTLSVGMRGKRRWTL